jgi:hypothetical protein
LLVGCSEYNYEAYPPKEVEVPEDIFEELDTEVETIEDTGQSLDEFEVPNIEFEGQATEIMYVHSDDELYSLNENGELTYIANFIVEGTHSLDDQPRITDLAIDLEGHMYGVAGFDLYEINASTGNMILTSTLNQYLNGLTFMANGDLMGAGDGIFKIDPTSGYTVTLVEDGIYNTSGDIVGHPNGLMYWTVRENNGDGLVSIDEFGRTSYIGNIGVMNLYGLGYFDGNLFGFSSDGNIVTINPDNAQAINNEIHDFSYWGAATNPHRWD